MIFEIDRIFVSNPKQIDPIENIEDENTDVIVNLANGDVYVASFFTYDSIETLRKAHFQNGKFLSGKYFWADGMVLVDSIGMETIEIVIQDLLLEGDFEFIFRKL